jgi:hypothetical protein
VAIPIIDTREKEDVWREAEAGGAAVRDTEHPARVCTMVEGREKEAVGS